MRVVPFLISLSVSILVIIGLDIPWGRIPPLGKFLSPQHGFWRNADPVDKDFSADLHFPFLKDSSTVYLDDRMVPHVFVKNESDAYFIEGWLHAKFRLWQMEFQVYAAAGRISELIGSKGLSFDRDKRRLGMVYAAERALLEMEKDSITKSECDAYTSGVNSYISSLNESDLPVEYKLLHYRPEKWNNLKTALFLKSMSLDLAGHEDDFEYSNARSVFGWSDFEKMYPYIQDSLDPIVPKGNLYPPPGVIVRSPVGSDSVYLRKSDSVHNLIKQPENPSGSNNWAVSGKKTQSGAPILCNDPHLALNLPSLWFEIQLSTPYFNAYGVSFPGAPGVIIGFNDSCAFGFTNAARDVRDYYEIKCKDDRCSAYLYNGEWKPTEFRYEHIFIRGEPEFIDTVAYTVFGPVMYDKSYSGGRSRKDSYFAVRWKAHDPSNELMLFNKLNHAKNYDDYFDAIQWLHTPGQNCVFASKAGDIAIWDQGEFPAKWKYQGDFIMPGTDSSYQWQGMIPQSENPHMINPQRLFVSSANQLPADPAVYPYYLGGRYPVYRGYTINRYLSQLNSVTAKDMMKLQTENYNVFAEMARPVLLRNIDTVALNQEEKPYYDILASWNLRNDPDLKGPTVFELLWENFTKIVWDDELHLSPLPMVYPQETTLLDAILKDSAFKFLDNIQTPARESLRDDVTEALKQTAAQCKKAEADKKLEWAAYKGTRVTHLARLMPFSRTDLAIGGGTHCINAAKETHGPSWRMVVQLSEPTEAFGIYPGGQSGNPGSMYYDVFIDDWAAGRYYPLWVMKKEEEKDKRVKCTIRFSGQ
jgi:penicillin amidase